MADYELWTYRDEIERVLVMFEMTAGGRQYNTIRMAILNAYRMMPAMHEWVYWNRRVRISTVAPYSTGTVVYDHTGGANERQVTLTSGTWPAWAAYGRLIIGTGGYVVDKRISDTVITLSENSNPGDDLSSSSFTICREGYHLPVNFGRTTTLVDVNNPARTFLYSADGEMFSRYGSIARTGRPVAYTFRGSDDTYGALQIVMSPPPDAVYSYDAVCQVKPRPLVYDLHAIGKVSVADATTTTVNGVNTDWTSGMVGSVIRFSKDGTNLPTGRAGGIDGKDNPYLYQRVITAVTNGTTLTVDSAVGQQLSDVRYTISDPLDIDSGPMLLALQRYTEYEASLMLRRSDAESRLAFFQNALRLAKGNDSRHITSPDAVRNGLLLLGPDVRAWSDYTRNS